MTSYSTPLPINENKGFIDRVVSGAENFNRKVAPVLQAGRTILGLGGLGLSTASSMYELGRSLSANKADANLSSIASDVYKNPSLLNEDLISKATPYLNTLGNFLNLYNGNNQVVGDKVISGLNSRHAEYTDLFNSANIEANISAITAENEARNYEATKNQMSALVKGDTINSLNNALSNASNAIGSMDSPSFLNSVRKGFRLMELDNYTVSSNRIDNLFNTYVANRNKNTLEGINQSVNAVNELSRIVRRTGNSDAYRALNALRYDLNVRLKRWEE